MESILKYKKHKRWYKDARKAIRRKYGKDAVLFSSLLASTSPRRHIKRNFRITEHIYKEYKRQGKCLLFYALTNKEQFRKEYELLPAHYNNVVLSLINHVKGKRSYSLSGLKVNSFFKNIIGQYQHVTIDVWILKFFHHTKSTFNKSDYIRYTQCLKSIKRHIRKNYKVTLDNAGLQAVLWEYQRSLEGFKPSNFVNHI